MAVSKKVLDDLFELLAIPSISAQKEHVDDMQKAALWLKNKLEKIGLKAKVLPTAGHPVVYAERIIPNTPHHSPTTVLIYGHYDVQDTGDISLWTTDPFKPEVRSDNIYGRGTADNKGQLYTWIAALEEIYQKDRKYPANIKFLIEGEEEVGSKNLDDFVEQNKSLLEANICVISDTHSLDEETPVLTYGLRGILYYELWLKVLDHDVHSGTYGGNVLNPIQIIANLISSIKNPKKEIAIPDFYKNVRKPSSSEKKALEKFPFNEKEIVKETGAEFSAGEDGYGIQVRVATRPSFDVNGIWGGYQGEGPKTIIPAEAGTKFSLRLVPNQSVEEIDAKVKEYINKNIPKGVEYKLTLLAGGEPILFERKSVYFKSAEKAFSKHFKNKPLHFAWGGSVPVTATFKTILGIDSIMMGYGLPDDNLHGPNEKLSLTMLEKGIKTNIEFLKSLKTN